ncbi:MAG: polynucleotide adenylyltransferase PcnB [Spirochaetaceae bacterium]|jgi:poly(A) polymerase|nr:polynucleotide adenylyltransferase PcnB [Spirochaetaceae bacterium]
MRIRYTTQNNGKPVKKAVVYTQDEHGISFTDVDSNAVYITERLRANGYETYIVGGAVRDLMLGKKPKDFDIVSDASPSRIKKIFRNARIIGRRFRLVHVYFGPKTFEVCTFRSLRDGPTSNTYGTIEEDVLRRDFSLNALFYDPGKQVVVDYVGGMKDIRNKRIRPIIPLSVIFKDDPVRMIRAVKYAAATGFTLPLSLRWKIKRQSPLLASISPSRLTEEIFKIIHSPAACRIIEDLETFGLYEYLQPNASGMMKKNAGFRARYLKSLAAINDSAPGEALSALIKDYLEDFVDWDGGVTENYKNAFLGARHYVLPINPPRVELDHAVRRIFGEHGITIKKTRFMERGKPYFPVIEDSGEPPDGEPPKRRRRRRKRPPAPDL